MFITKLKNHCALEFQASQMYLAVSIAASQAGYYGLSKWCVGEAQDEITHGNIILSLIRDVYGVDFSIKSATYATPKAEDFGELVKILLEGEIAVANSVTEMFKETDCLAISELIFLGNVQRDSIRKLRELYKQITSASGDEGALQAIDKSLENNYVFTRCPEPI